MHHSSIHGDGNFSNFITDSHLIQRGPSANRKGQINRLSRYNVCLSNIRPSFVKRYLVAGLGQVDGPKGTYESRANNRSCFWLLHGSFYGLEQK